MKTLLITLLLSISIFGQTGGGSRKSVLTPSQKDSIGAIISDSLDNFSSSLTFSGNVKEVGIDRTYTDIQSAINAASSGDIVLIYNGTYTVDSLALKNNVHLIGSGDVTIYNSSTSATQWILQAYNDTLIIKDVTIKGRNLLKAFGSANVKLYNVDFKPRDADVSSKLARISVSNTSKFTAYNCNLYSSSPTASPTLIEDNANFNWYGGSVVADVIRFYDNCTFDFRPDYASAGVTGGITVGETNYYNSAITGTDGDWKAKDDANYNNYVASNDSSSPNGIIEIPNIDSLTYGVTLNRNAIVRMINTNLGGEYNRFLVTGSNHSHLEIHNSKFSKLSASNGDPFILVDNSVIRYDWDYTPEGDTSNVYDANYWSVYGEGSHTLETNRIYNTALIPNMEIRNSLIEYMGDDVLNNLPEGQALKEMEVNPNWVVDGTTRPDSSSIAGSSDWAETTAYNVGDYFFYVNRLFIVVDGTYESTDSASFLTDLNGNNFRLLFAANRQDNGKYQSWTYHKTNGWAVSHRLDEYHGGRFRNRGNPVVGYFTNLFLYNVKVVRHNNVFTWKNNFSSVSTYGTQAYAAVMSANAFKELVINDAEIINYGTVASGLYIVFEDSLTNKKINLDNLSLSEGIANGVEFDAVSYIDSDSNSVKIGHISSGTYLNPIRTISLGGHTLDDLEDNTEQYNYFGGDVTISKDLIVGGGLTYGTTLFTTSLPFTMQESGTAGDTVLITVNYTNDLMSTASYDESYIEFNLYSHIQYSSDNNANAGLLQIKYTAFGDADADMEFYSEDSLYTKNLVIASNWLAPTLSEIGVYSSSSTAVVFYVTNSSVAYDTKLWVKILQARNIASISLEAI